MKFTSLITLAFLLILTSCSSQLTAEEYLQRGSDYMNKKEWKSAIIEFKNSIKQAPKNSDARISLGKAYLKVLNSEAAIKEFRKAIELGIDKNKVLVALGEAYAQRNKSKELISEITLSNTLNKDDTLKVLALRAGAFMHLKDLENTLSELEKAKQLDSNNTAVRLMWARYEAQQNRVDEQLKWLEPLLSLDIADAWSQMGKIEQSKQNFEAAEVAYSKAITIRNQIHPDYLSRAIVQISLKKYDEANNDLRLLKKAGLNTPMISHSEAVIAFYQKDFDLAQSKLDEVLKKYKDYPPSLFVLGLTHFQKKNFESTINTLSQYLEIIPKNLQARFVLATALLESNKLEQAILELELLYKKDPNNTKVSSLLGGAYLRNGQLPEGITLFKRSAHQNPKQAVAQFQLGSALIRDKKTVKKGQQALLKALDLEPELFQANISLYLSYMQSKTFDHAASIAQKMIDIKPSESLGYNLLAQTHLAQGDNVKATKLFESTLVKFPSDPLTSGNIARIKIKGNKIEEAKSIYLKVLDQHPKDLRSLISLSILESKSGNHSAKIDYLTQAIKFNPSVLSPKLILASEYLKSNNYKDALEVLKNISEVDKKRIEVQLINAKATIGLKKYDYAQVLLKKLVTQNPNSSSAYFLLGQNYGHLKQKDNMKDAFKQALKIKPDYFPASLILARIALLDGNKDEFEKRVLSLSKAYPQNADVKFLKAKLASSNKDYKSAVLTLEGLLKDNTLHNEIVMDIARNKWASGDKDGAIAGLDFWLESNPEDKKVLMLLAQFYINQNRFEEANAVYAKVEKLIPNNAIVLNNMAWLYRESNIKLGIKLAKRALSLEPQSPFIKDTLAMLLLDDNNADEALSYSKQAAESQPDFVEIQMNYAKVLIATGDKINAKSVLNTMMAKSSSFEQRQKIRILLNSL